jgi:hypothetical protein
MGRLRKQMTYANVMSSIAVFVVLGGGAYAAATLPKNSVGSTQIKANAVSSSKVKDGSLLSKDFKPGQLVAGARGATGATGATGTAGTAGAKGDKGDKGDTGAAGAVRAYGVMRSDGTLVGARSKNVTVSNVPGNPLGAFCVTPTADSGIDATKTTIVLTPDYNDGDGVFHIVQTVLATAATQPPDCPGGFELVTDNFDDGANMWSRTDIALSFLIP